MLRMRILNKKNRFDTIKYELQLELQPAFSFVSILQSINFPSK